jgi:hypothetical protein
MNKNNTKKNNTYNVIAVNAISEKRGLSKQYVRQCIKGDRNSISADIVKKEYRDMVRKIELLLIK